MYRWKKFSFMLMLAFVIVTLIGCMHPTISTEMRISRVVSARFYLPEGGIDNGYVEIMAVVTTSDEKMDEKLAEEILKNVKLTRKYKAEIPMGNPVFHKIDTASGKLEIVWKDDLKDISSDLKDGDKLYYTFEITSDRIDNYEVPKNQKKKTVEVIVKKKEEVLDIDYQYDDDGLVFKLKGYENWKSYGITYRLTGSEGKVIIGEKEVSGEDIKVAYNLLKAKTFYSLIVTVKDTNGKVIDELRRDFIIPDDPIIEADIHRDPSDPTKVNVDIDYLKVVDKVSYEVEGIVSKTEATSKKFTLNNISNDNVHTLNLYFHYKTGEEYKVQLPIKIYLTEKPSFTIQKTALNLAKQANAILEGIRLNLDTELVEKYFKEDEYKINYRFYVDNSVNAFLNKYMKVIYDNDVVDFYVHDPFALKSANNDLYNRIINAFGSDANVYKNVHMISGKPIKVVASIIPNKGSLSDYFENPEKLSDIESNEIESLKGAVFAKLVNAMVVSKTQEASIIIYESDVEKAFPESGDKYLVVYFKESNGSEKWGYVVYDLNSDTETDSEYNSIPAVIKINHNTEKKYYDISVKYTGEESLTYYYAFIDEYNRGYYNWKASEDVSKLDEYIGSYSAIGGTLKVKKYELLSDYNYYFLAPAEISEKTIRIIKNSQNWADEKSPIFDAVQDGYITNVEIKLKDGDAIKYDETFPVNQPYFDITVPEPGKEYTLSISFYGKDNREAVKKLNDFKFVKKLMLSNPSMSINNIEKGESTCTINININEIPGTLADTYFVIYVNTDTNDDYGIIKVDDASQPLNMELSLNATYRFVVVPWIDGKYEYLKAAVGAPENDIEAYLENHILQPLKNNNLLEARKYYYKVITSKELEYTPVKIRSVDAQRVSANISQILYLEGNKLALSVALDNINDPNNPDDFEDYKVVVELLNGIDNTAFATDIIPNKATSWSTDLGIVENLPEKILVNIYPYYKRDSSSGWKDGDHTYELITVPPVLNWDNIKAEVMVDPYYRENDKDAIIINLTFPENSNFEVSYEVKDVSSTVIDNGEVTFNGNGQIVVDNLEYDTKYYVDVSVKSKDYDAYKWRSDEDKEKYTTRKLISNKDIKTKSVIYPIDFAASTDESFGERFGFVYMDELYVGVDSFKSYLKLNKDKENVISNIEGIVVGYSESDNQNDNGKLVDLSESTVKWNNTELKDLLSQNEAAQIKTYVGLKEGTQYYFQIITQLKARTGYVEKFSSIRTYKTAGYLKDIETDDVKVVKEDESVKKIIINNFNDKYLTDIDGVDKYKNYYVIKVLSSSMETLKEASYTIDDITARLDENGNLVIGKKFLNFVKSYNTIHVHIFPVSLDVRVKEKFGSEKEQEDKFGVDVVISQYGRNFIVKKWSH